MNNKGYNMKVWEDAIAVASFRTFMRLGIPQIHVPEHPKVSSNPAQTLQESKQALLLLPVQAPGCTQNEARFPHH